MAVTSTINLPLELYCTITSYFNYRKYQREEFTNQQPMLNIRNGQIQLIWAFLAALGQWEANSLLPEKS